MKETGTIGDKLLFFLIFLFPFLPTNFYIGPLNYSNVCVVLIVMVYLLTRRKCIIINPFIYIGAFWVNLIVYAVFALATDSILTGVAYFIAQFAISCIVISIIKNEKDFYKIIDNFLLSAIVLGVVGVIEALTKTYLIQGAIFNGTDSIRYGVLRSVATFGHPINFGIYQGIAAILAFYRLKTVISRKQKRLCMSAYLLSIISMFLSVSRLAICLFVAIQLILLLQMGIRNFMKYICMAGLFIVIIISILDLTGLGITELFHDLVETVRGDVLGLQSTSSNSAIGMGNRYDLYKWVIDAVGENMLLGKGVGAIFSFQMNPWFTKTSVEVHYLYIYFQCGLVGLLSLVISYISSLRFFGRNSGVLNNKEKVFSFSKVLFVTLFVYYICLLGVQETDLTRMYCLLISLGIAYVRIRKKNYEGNKERSRNENRVNISFDQGL